ncbi:regulator of chromosome condensation3 [Zea mays]|uniref:Regulator of chromosome condensation3 n=1 Tax=Zea mays TaxID=4577 RepID=A0A1D6Q1E7_MAIZE|nr:regulator of chromosome condensation3 [Zea mays]
MATPLRATAVLAWGSGEDGQLGMGGNEEKDWPHFVEALGPYAVTAVVAGSRNSLAICDDGRLFTWGWNQRGTLGHPPETKTESSPGPVDALAGFKIVQAAIGGWHCLAVDDKGRAYAWGGNEYGQCGEEPERKEDGTRALRRDIPIPQRCALKLKVRQVAAGGTHSVVLTQEGHVWTWGQPWPPGDIKQISTPVRVQGLEKVRVIAVGAFHNLALTEDVILWAWGNNEYGQLGTGDTQPRSQPIRVEGLSDLSLVDIAAGGWHSTALTIDGEYGRGDHGRLGYGRKVTTGHPMELPINLPPLSSSRDGRWQAKYVACGGRHTLAIAEWTEATD